MDRRSFFHRLAGIGAGASLAGVTPVPVPVHTQRRWPGSPDEALAYCGYLLFWTGWKAAQDHTWLAGQWLAWPERSYGMNRLTGRLVQQPYLYLNVPGFIGGPYRPGSVFNLISRGGLVDENCSAAQREAYIAEGETYIRQLAEAYQHTQSDTLRSWSAYEFPLTGRVHPVD